MFIQPLLERSDGSRVPLDDLIGTGFAVIEWHDQADLQGEGAVIRARERVPLPLAAIRLGLLRRDQRFVGECPGNRPADPAWPLLVRDETGALAQAFDEAGVRGVILRPDRYVAAAIARDAPAGEAARLLEALRAQSMASLR
jgi:hypothetical protein